MTPTGARYVGQENKVRSILPVVIFEESPLERLAANGVDNFESGIYDLCNPLDLFCVQSLAG